jgi:multiple sugar transport system substrate-binding protein
MDKNPLITFYVLEEKMRSPIWKILSMLAVFAMLLTACAPVTPTAAPNDMPAATQAPAAEKVKLTMWYHGAGNKAEKEVLLGIINDYNASQSKYVVEVQDFPQISYNDSVVAAALAGSLPDIIDVDGPVMPNWAWAGYMAPLDIPQDKLEKFLPTTIGKWNGKVYAVGLWEAACAFYARKSVLDKYGIRIPTLEKPWNLQEFNTALETIMASGEYKYVLDMGMAWKGEWYPYGFSPFLQSFGGDIIDRSTFTTAEGALNGPEAIAFGKWWQDLFTKGYVSGTTQDSADRDTGFIDGKYALQWNGNWAGGLAKEKIGDDLLILPAPNFGNGSRIGAGSWEFGVSATSKNIPGATEFVQFMMQDKYMVQFSDVTGNIPATATAAAASKNYKPGAPFEIFFKYTAAQATLRPPTPAYLTAAKIFEKALADIANGADVTATLDQATDEINADIKANKGYGFDGSVVGPIIKEDLIAKANTGK